MNNLNNEKKKDLNNNINLLNEKIDRIEKKLDFLIDKIDNDVIYKCDKMSSHIDFIDSVYENVKNPLNYVCNKINNYSLLYNTNDNKNSKTLEDKKS